MQLHRNKICPGLRTAVINLVTLALVLGVTSQAGASSFGDESESRFRLYNRLEASEPVVKRAFPFSKRHHLSDAKITIQHDIGEGESKLFDKLRLRGPIRGMRLKEWVQSLRGSGEGYDRRTHRRFLRDQKLGSMNQAVPEPGTAVLLGLGLTALAAGRRRQNR